MVNFIRKQMKLGAIIETILNNEQRLQILENHRFKLDLSVSENSGSEMILQASYREPRIEYKQDKQYFI